MGSYSPVESDGTPIEEVVDDHKSLVNNSSRWSRKGVKINDNYTGGRYRKITDSIGIARITILGVGTICIFAAAGVLAFLWRGAAIAARQDDPGTAWKAIGNAGWATVTVAICSAILRTAISLQAGLIMSMVASILLERHPIRLQDAAFLSINRAVSIQPVSLLFNGGRGVLKSSSQLAALIVVAGAIAIASTFTSTILLSDFANMVVVGDSTTSLIGYTDDGMASRIDFWRSPPGPYARFAESTNSSSSSSSSSRISVPHVDDTGLTLRVPLPLPSSGERETLRSYVGPATVFDNRVICVAPNLNISSLNQSRSEEPYSQYQTSIAILGSFTFDKDLPLPLQVPSNASSLEFRCQLPTDQSRGLTWNLSICVLESLDAIRIANVQSPISIQSFLPLYEDVPFYQPYGFAIFNVTPPTRGFTQVGYSSAAGIAIPRSSLNMTTTDDGPWATAKVTAGLDLLDGASFSVTVCVTNLEGRPHNVTLASDADGTEPTMAWTGAAHQGRHNGSSYYAYNTSWVRRQLNAVPAHFQTPAERRGLMTLSLDATDWSAPLSNTTFNLDIKALFPHFTFFQPPGSDNMISHGTAVMSFNQGYGRGFDLGHPMHTALFTDAPVETGSPARALQAWLTTMLMRNLYDSLGRFTQGDQAVLVRSTTVLAPARWAGLAAVMAILVAHLVVVAWATVCFVRTTRHTLLGHSWLGVAQVVSDTTLPLLWQAGDLKDGEMRALIREEVGESQRYGVVRLRKTGRTALAPI